MKKLMVKALALVVSATTLSSFGAGFALYQGSAAGNALGGAVMGKAVDGSAVFYNPATMTDFGGTVVTFGMVTEHPTADTRVSLPNGTRVHSGKMDPGFFVLPHAYLIQPLGEDFRLGLGFAPEYGLGSHYNDGWAMDWNTQSTTIKGLVFNPNLAYKITDSWSVAAGARVMYISFEQASNPTAYIPTMGNVGGLNLPLGAGAYHMNNRIYNAYDWAGGWELSTKYDITEKLHAGVLYKSYIDTKLKGKQRVTNVPVLGKKQIMPGVAVPAVAGHTVEGVGGAKVRLPQSVTAGLNYDVTEDLELGTALTWTQWSCLKGIDFDLPSGRKYVKLGWKDTYRATIGGSYRFAEDWKFMLSYTYDMDPCRTKKDYGSTMLPPGDRHIAAMGLSWDIGAFTISGSYACVFFHPKSLELTNEYTGQVSKFDTHGGMSHAGGVSLTYHF